MSRPFEGQCRPSRGWKRIGLLKPSFSFSFSSSLSNGFDGKENDEEKEKDGKPGRGEPPRL